MLRRLSLKVKLLGVAIMPVLGLSVFTLLELYDSFSTLNRLKTLDVVIRSFVHFEELITELQRERGLSSGFIGSRGARFYKELHSQREAVDKRIEELTKSLPDLQRYLGSKLKEDIIYSLSSKLGTLKNTREKISNLQLDGKSAFDYFTDLIGNLIDVLQYYSKLFEQPELKDMVYKHFLLVSGKELAGQERGFLNMIISQGFFKEGEFAVYSGIVSKQKNMLNMFFNLADEDVKKFYMDKVSGEAVSEVERIRDFVLKKASVEGLDVDPSYWWRVATQRIDMIGEVEKHLLGLILNRAKDIRSRNLMGAIVMLAFVVVGISLTLIFGIIFSMSILRELGGEPFYVADIIRSLAKGDLRVDIKVSDRDNTSIVANLRNMNSSLRKLIGDINASAQRVGEIAGSLNSITERTLEGVKGQSIQIGRITTAVEETDRNMAQVAKNARVVEHSAELAVVTAQKGKDIANEAVRSVGEVNRQSDKLAALIRNLNRAAKEISIVVTLIRDIADRTNILALNAAIEAARAGEKGKSFAVVSDEIRKLATETVKATRDIEGKINAIQSEAMATLDAMERAGAEVKGATEYISEVYKSLDEIISSVKSVREEAAQIARAVETQAKATQDISKGILAISSASENIENMAQQVMDEVKALGFVSQNLMKEVANFKL